MTGAVNINYKNANDYLTGNYHTVKYNKIALKKTVIKIQLISKIEDLVNFVI